MLTISISSLTVELALTHFWVHLPSGHCAWINLGKATDHARPFFETWNDGRSRHVRLGRWEGIFDREQPVVCG